MKTIVIPIVLLLLGGGIFDFWGFRIREAMFGAVLPLFRLQSYLGDMKIFNSGTISQGGEVSRRIFELKLAEYEEEIRSLRRILKLKEEIKPESKTARVVWYGKELDREIFILDQGKNAEIEVGDIVVDRVSFLLGTVREVWQDFAKVAVASNVGEAYEVEFLPVGAKALARGIGAKTFAIELIPADFAIRKGDFVVLAGFGGTYFFLGEIVREETSGGSALKQARAVSLAEPNRIADVLVIKSKKQPSLVK